MPIKKQKQDKELEITKQYDYKSHIEKVVLRLYMHSAIGIGMIVILMGLVAYNPPGHIYSLALMVFGAFVIATAWLFIRRLNKR